MPHFGECGNLTVDKKNDLVMYNAALFKTNKMYETYALSNDLSIISVTLDWYETGEAPEVKVSGIHKEKQKCKVVCSPSY
ncbi:unnamed protein product [Hymenolepis diminuta]|uniref:Uncharacterized protein n=1 Tax=Hymenolepis diminuta TaxID=6216 RepID=A0A564ZEB8_HYMDI|nr:unnamed protein product [Hymenolepis diminuta]